ncbi:MAG: NUDIX domain-containing protein [bacterium]|nr:NUDIX domain-containing protein [bacterium]
MINPIDVKGFCEKPKLCIGVIIIKNGKVLFGKRKNSHCEGMFEIPGGHLDQIEGLEEGARREVMEETGLKLSDIKFCSLTNDIIEGKHYVSLGFVGETIGEPELREPHKCEGWDWYDFDNLPKPLFPISSQIIKHYKNKVIVDDPFSITVT